MIVSMMDNLDYLAFLLTIMAAACMLLMAWLKIKWSATAGLLLNIAAAVSMLAALAMRTSATGHLPVNSVYDFLLTFSFVLIAFNVFWQIKVKLYPIAVFLLTVAAVLLGISFYQADTVSPLLPALQSNWRVSHVLTAIISYASFALAFALGVFYLLVIRVKKGEALPEAKKERGESIEKLMYNAVVFGFIFLTLLIITGAMWAEEAWGIWWSWDPKETWALITWIIYAIYLHLHAKPAWRGRKGCWLSVIGFACVMFTLLGVTYFMGGLHSYG